MLAFFDASKFERRILFLQGLNFSAEAVDTLGFVLEALGRKW
jgi:hypothetical protein